MNLYIVSEENHLHGCQNSQCSLPRLKPSTSQLNVLSVTHRPKLFVIIGSNNRANSEREIKKYAEENFRATASVVYWSE
jgi:hypothetical protein